MAQVTEPPADRQPEPGHGRRRRSASWHRSRSRRRTASRNPSRGRRNPRQAAVDLIRRRLTDRLQPASWNAAEVETLGHVTVAAVCPRCGIASDILLVIDAELRTDRDGSELRLKGKSKARAHVCGQQRLDDTLDGQGSFELEDIVGDVPPGTDDDGLDDAEDDPPGTIADAHDDALDLGACPFPGCILAAEHEGAHAGPDWLPPDDDAGGELPVCRCGKPKVRADRRWVCTNPDHPAAEPTE